MLKLNTTKTSLIIFGMMAWFLVPSMKLHSDPVAIPPSVSSSALQPQSKLWLIGDSTLHAWQSAATKIDASIEFQPADPTKTADALTTIRNGGMTKLDVVIPVVDMTSGEKQLDKNMQKALKCPAHPEIRFHMLSYQTVPSTTAVQGFIIKAVGELEVAGTKKNIDLEATATNVPEGVRIQGTKELLMTDFGVKPPVLLVIRTRNRVIVHYDLVLASKN